ncbi:MAG: hypothetical protein JST66_08955 [Bacteroidetes bacterium]|nr:hypothetical protein [Bacteroidota bacterium]
MRQTISHEGAEQGPHPPPAPIPLQDRQAELERELLESFLASPRWRPAKPLHFNESIVILRGNPVPHYHAVFDHATDRYVELRYPHPYGGWRTVPLPADRAPLLIDRRQQPHIRPRGTYRKQAVDEVPVAGKADGAEPVPPPAEEDIGGDASRGAMDTDHFEEQHGPDR